MHINCEIVRRVNRYSGRIDFVEKRRVVDESGELVCQAYDEEDAMLILEQLEGVVS